jgi:hypothetical protein
LNETLRTLVKTVNFSNYVKIETVENVKTRWTIHPNNEVRFLPEIKDMLGLHRKVLRNSSNIPQVEYVRPDLMRNFRRIFLESNIVYPETYFRDGKRSMLASFAVESDSKISAYTWPSPIYYQLNANVIEKLEIKFTDEFGRQLMMLDGHAWVLAHIRPMESE